MSSEEILETSIEKDDIKNEIGNEDSCLKTEEKENNESVNEDVEVCDNTKELVKVPEVADSDNVEEKSENINESGDNVVKPSNNNNKENVIDELRQDSMYKGLLELQDENIVLCQYGFECPICLEKYDEYDGIILKGCLHVFCVECIRQTALLNDNIDIKCPYKDNEYSCPSLVQESEIQALFTKDEYSKRLKKTLEMAETTCKFTFHCQKPDCTWWFVNEDGLLSVECPVCLVTNCIHCQAIHTGISCEQYADKLNPTSHPANVRKSEAALAEMVRAGLAMYCPQCTAVVQKESGCDALCCSICKTALCWATKGIRWGPAGQGDNSAGCRCNVNGKKCHYNCRNCH